MSAPAELLRVRNPKRLPALLPTGADLSTVKTAALPGLPRFLMLGAYHAGRVGVYAVPPGTHWQLNAPDLSLRDAEQLERRAGASFLEGSTLTLTAEGYRPAVLPVRTVRVLREVLEALEQLEGVPLPVPLGRPA
ncbi:hypothetical protein F8S09_14185 [Deinococcus sp. SDU3-2]|uniref:Uncharacterized protein n=1 Tax=Deinococcus terrestris TaxID=2651870 RepID=A0A7X1NXV3_9DEIO|nr:hypothetical protein [Deinococcus terrestris]MPY67817.1 hypothetical protein [Deinococcus terrestris]